MNIDCFELMILISPIIPIFHYSKLPRVKIHCPEGNNNPFPWFPD